MYDMRLVFFLILLYGVFAVPVPEDEALLEFIEGNHKFTSALYKEIIKEETKNFIASPFSLEVVLAMINEGARGETSAELERGLSLPNSKEKTQTTFKSLLPNLKRSDNVQFLSANKMYTDDRVLLKEDFRRTAETIYDSGVESVSFLKNKDQAIVTINKWVENNTNDKIQDLIKPADINADTLVVLVNCLYFSGKWVHSFDDTLTFKQAFYETKDDFVQVDTMRLSQFFNYYEDPVLNAKLLELPYKGGDISMHLVLPNNVDGLKDLEQNMERLLLDITPYSVKEVYIELPRFSIEGEIKFIPILKNLGIKKLFEDGDLTGVSLNYDKMYVSQVAQKAFINVTEEGTEAAAASSGELSNRNGFCKCGAQFIADHPFLYFIKSKGVVVFVGRYTSP